jgi:hypothetical protein
MPFIGDDGEFLTYADTSFVRRLAMMRLAFLAALVTISGPVLADPGPMGLPDFSIEKSCSLFAGHPRPLVLCQDTESRYRGEVASSWAQTPVLEREACVKLASQSQRGKYEVLARCLRTAISEAAWKDAVGSIKQSAIVRDTRSP